MIPVTIAVVCYNSADFIIETLESVFQVNHEAVELIISDDASKDNTWQLVEDWLQQERVQQRFTAIKKLRVEKNTGVSPNCNRCVQAATAEWIILLAGDDVVLKDTIKDNLAYIQNNPTAKVVFSQVQVFHTNYQPDHFVRVTPLNFPENFFGTKVDAQEQYQQLLVSDRIHYTPSAFFNVATLRKVGLFDEQFPMVEDYPMWLKLTKLGIRLHYFHQITVGYRVHEKASNNVSDNSLFKPALLYSHAIRKVYVFPYYPFDLRYSEQITYWVSKWFKNNNWNHNKPINSWMYKLLTHYLNPFSILVSLKRRIPYFAKNTLYN
jgi:alpha-1,3-rhamnosyltransferase